VKNFYLSLPGLTRQSMLSVGTGMTYDFPRCNSAWMPRQASLRSLPKVGCEPGHDVEKERRGWHPNSGLPEYGKSKKP
jgi:hypothetical protein